MSIDFQKEKERIELKHSTYIGSIGIYMEFSEKIEDAFFKYYFYDGIREEEAINFIFSMFSSIVEEHLKGQKILDIERDLFQICNTEYVFYIYDCGKGTFLFDWNPKLADLDAALLLYYALINLSQSMYIPQKLQAGTKICIRLMYRLVLVKVLTDYLLFHPSL